MWNNWRILFLTEHILLELTWTKQQNTDWPCQWLCSENEIKSLFGGALWKRTKDNPLYLYILLALLWTKLFDSATMCSYDKEFIDYNEDMKNMCGGMVAHGVNEKEATDKNSGGQSLNIKPDYSETYGECDTKD